LGRQKSLGYQINTNNQQKNHPFQGKGLKKTRVISSWPTSPGGKIKKNNGGNLMLLLGNTTILGYLFANYYGSKNTQHSFITLH